MSYRDDRDAMLARNDALEREVAVLRRQLKEQKEKEKEKEKEAARRARRARGAGRAVGNRKMVLLAVFATVVPGILVLGIFLSVEPSAPSPGRPSNHELPANDDRPPYNLGLSYVGHASLVERDGRVVVAALASYGWNEPRSQLSHFDIHSGERVRALELEGGRDQVSLFEPFGDRLWIRRGDGKLALIDLVGPAVELSGEALVAAVPELADGYQVTLPSFDQSSLPTAAVEVTLHDGRSGWIDMTPAFRTSRPPAQPGLDGSCGPLRYVAASCDRTECVALVPLPGTTALALSSAPASSDGQHLGARPIAEGASPLHRPTLVTKLGTACAFETDDSVLVLHDSAALAPKEPLISLVERATGQIRWTRPMTELSESPRGHDRALGARLVAGEIVLLLRTADRLVLDLVRLSLAGEVVARHRLL